MLIWDKYILMFVYVYIGYKRVIVDEYIWSYFWILFDYILVYK